MGTDGVVTYYAGSFVYTGSSLTYLQHPEGLYFPSSGGYHYFLKDHLGNTRMMVNTLGTGGTIVQQTDYYPFGMEIASFSSGVENRYRYNGKEKQNDLINGKNLDWYDYGARMYDPSIGRWHTPDPLAESYRRWSPYNYCMNNPLKLTDPDGRGPELALYFVPGVGEVLLAATAVAAVSYVAYKAGEATYNAVKDARAGQREQQKRERTQKEALDKNQANVQKSIENNVGKPSPDGTPDPKGDLSTIGKVVVGSGLAAEGTKEFIESTGNTKTQQDSNAKEKKSDTQSSQPQIKSADDGNSNGKVPVPTWLPKPEDKDKQIQVPLRPQ